MAELEANGRPLHMISIRASVPRGAQRSIVARRAEHGPRTHALDSWWGSFGRLRLLPRAVTLAERTPENAAPSISTVV